MALTMAQITTAFNNVLQRDPSDNELNSYFTVSQSGALTDAQVYASIVNSPEATSFVNPIVRFYQAAFGRVPDQSGLKAQVKYEEALGGTVAAEKTIAANFTISQEFTNRYGTGTTVDTAYLNALYVNVLGRTGSSTEIQNWLNTVADPNSGYKTKADVLFGFAQSPEFTNDAAAGINSFLTMAAQGTATYMGSLAINPGGGAGTTFTFTQAIDNLAGTAGNDTFVGDNTTGTPTVSSGDQVNGQGGTDTFNYFVSNVVLPGSSPPLPTLTGVEVVNVIGEASSRVYDISAQTGITNFNVKNPTGNVSDTITVGAGVTVGFDNVKTTGNANETVNYTSSVTNGALEVRNGSTVATIAEAGSGLTTASVNSTGSAANTVTTLSTPNAVKSLTLTGDQALKITTALNNNITTIDASNDTGGVNVRFGSTANNVTATAKGGSGADTFDISGTGGDTVVATLGAGNDTLKVGGGGVLASFLAGTSLDGGDGTDIFNLQSGADLTTTTAAFIKNFEVLDVSGGSGTYNTTLFTGFQSAQANSAISGNHGDVVLSNVASTGFSFNEIAAKGMNATPTSLELDLKTAASTTDSATLTLTATDGNNDTTANGVVTLGAFKADGTGTSGSFETLNLVSNVVGIDTGLKATSYTNTITTLTDGANGNAGDSGLTTLTISGGANLTITNALAAATAANLTKIDASASTANVTLDYSNAVKGVTYVGAGGIDSIIATKAGTSIAGNGGNDQITLSNAHTASDTLVYKAATDTTQTLDASGTKIAGQTLETINFFAATADKLAAHDTIDVTAFGFAGTQRGVANLGTLTNAPDGGSFAATSSTLFTDAGGARGVAVGQTAADTFVFVDANKDGVFNASQDLVIKVTGLHAIAANDVAF